MAPEFPRHPAQGNPKCSFNEAGANWPRNSAAARRDAVLLKRASMRPGPIGPGILRMGPETFQAFRASMRPGPIGPGIALARLPCLGVAAASMRPGPIGPGINRRQRQRQRRTARFNEAGANWPRNSCKILTPCGQHAASMRPGPIGPGIDVAPPSPPVTTGFNEAGANWPRNLSRIDSLRNLRVMLQ